MNPSVESPSARELIALTLDAGSFLSWDAPLPLLPIEETYADELERARQRSQEDEAVLTGEGTINGGRVAVIVGEFRFLGGSIGVSAAERIVRAFTRATAQRIPVLAAPISGGTRMQEGTIAFLQMVKITEAVGNHKAAHLPYLVYLRNPTTGGVFASWGSLGHITVAQTGALIGFLGPKVYRALRGDDFPPNVQTAENLYRHGIVDAVLDPQRLRHVTGDALGIMQSAPKTAAAIPAESLSETTMQDAWTSIEISRRSDRPGLRSLLHHAASSTVRLSGTGQGESNKTSVVSLATFGGHGVIVVGFDRRVQRDLELGPDALRQARRGMSLAAELRMPLITVIDTPGAALSKEAEEGGLGGEIARCLADLIMLPVPTVSVILGEGTGGGALALIPADRVIAARHGWLAPLPPEGASVIRFGTVDRAREMAEVQRVKSEALLHDGIIDEIIEENPSADVEPAEFCRRMGRAIVAHLDDLTSSDPAARFARRANRYRTLGQRH